MGLLRMMETPMVVAHYLSADQIKQSFRLNL
jgi:hypothetical protein